MLNFLRKRYKFNFASILSPVQGAHEPVDAIAGIAVNAAHTPIVQPLNQKIPSGLTHNAKPPLASFDSYAELNQIL